MSLVEDHLDMVMIRAAVFAKKYPCEDWRDYVTSGYIGLTEAAKSFDPNRGVKFETFAQHRVDGAIIDQYRSDHGGRGVNRRRVIENTEPIGERDFVSVDPIHDDFTEAVARRMPTREHRVIVNGLAGGCTMKDIGSAVGLSESRMSQKIAEIRPLVAAAIEGLK